MATFFRRRSAFLSAGTTFVVMVFVFAPFVRPVAAASDNTNLIQQILTLVQQIESQIVELTGLGGSLSTLQGDISTIKAKTSNLPDNTAAVLTEIGGNVGSPLTRMFMHSFHVGQGATGSMSCSSTGPFLLYVHGHGLNADLGGDLNGNPLNFGAPVPVNFVLGGNAGDVITLRLFVQDISNPNAFGDVFVTMQTTPGSVVGCN